MKKVGIILVNYQDYARKYLASCRDSLRLQGYSNAQVYIIDNASSFESKKYLQDSYPEAIVIPRSDGNYCAANNVGMKRAISDGCDYLIALNMDTEVQVDWLEMLVLALEHNPQAGIAQSLVLLAPKNKTEEADPLVNTSGNLIHFLFFGFTSNYKVKKSLLNVSSYSEIAYASGCSFIIRQEVFQEIGAYDEDYYMYHDDLDLSLKTHLAAYTVILAQDSIVFHKYEFERSVRMLYYMERNRALSFFVFYPVQLILLLLPLFIAMNLGMGLFALKGSWLKTKLKVDGYFFKVSTWQMIIKKRKLLKSLAKVPFKNVYQEFKGKVEFQEIDNPVLKYLVNPVFNACWALIKRIV